MGGVPKDFQSSVSTMSPCLPVSSDQFSKSVAKTEIYKHSDSYVYASDSHKKSSAQENDVTSSVSSSSHVLNVKQESEEEPVQKKPRQTVEIRAINENAEKFHPTIAEKIKLRERKYSQSYDEEVLKLNYENRDYYRKSPNRQGNNGIHPYLKKTN